MFLFKVKLEMSEHEIRHRFKYGDEKRGMSNVLSVIITRATRQQQHVSEKDASRPSLPIRGGDEDRWFIVT